MPQTILVTGGCGFVGHHFVEHLLKTTQARIVVLDKLSYAANGFDRLRDINCFDDNRVTVLSADFTLPLPVGIQQEIAQPDYILHLGAETHVDNSIRDTEPFVRSNVLGTMHLLNYARTLRKLKTFLYFSTDEVFGPAPHHTRYKEGDRYNSGNPYAATKAGAEQLALAYANTYGLPIVITRTMNIYGERQHPEKFIPSTIRKILNSEAVTIHANPEKTKAGSRFYIHARNVAKAVSHILALEPPNGEQYHIVGEREVDNLELATLIAKYVGMPLKFELVDFHSSRPGHDLRYALDGRKLKRLGWTPPMSFEQALEKTVHWTLQHPKWLER